MIDCGFVIKFLPNVTGSMQKKLVVLPAVIPHNHVLSGIEWRHPSAWSSARGHHTRNNTSQGKNAPGKILDLSICEKKLANYLSLVAAVTFPAASLATSSTLFVASLAASFTVSAALSIAWPAFSMALSTSFPARSAGPSPAFFPHPARLNPSKMAVTIRQPFL